MPEKSPDEFIDALERRWRRREKAKLLLSDIAISLLMISGSAAATAYFHQSRYNDTLPPE